MLQGDSFLAPRKSLITFKCPFNKKSISSLLLELPCYRMNRIFKQDLLRRCISVKLYRIFQNTIVHIHYKETHIWEVILFFFFLPSITLSLRSISSHLLCVSSSLLLSSPLSYYFLLYPQVLYASSVGSGTFIAVPFCVFPTSATGFKNPRAGASSCSFSDCVLVTIPHTQGLLNMCLLTVTLVAVFMHLGWKRDFLSCNVLKSLQQDS